MSEFSLARRRKYTSRRKKEAVRSDRWKEILASGAVGLATSGLAHYLNTEEKFFDATFTQTPDTSGNIQWITDVDQGDGSTQRIGDSIKLTSIQFRCAITKEAVGTLVRYIIFADREWDPAGTAPSPSQVLNTTGALPNGVLSPLNRDNTKRFHVIWDKVYQFPNLANTAQGIASFHKYKTMDHHVNWASDGSTQSSVREGHLYLLAITNRGAASSEPTVHTWIRFRYVDN